MFAINETFLFLEESLFVMQLFSPPLCVPVLPFLFYPTAGLYIFILFTSALVPPQLQKAGACIVNVCPK